MIWSFLCWFKFLLVPFGKDGSAGLKYKIFNILNLTIGQASDNIWY